MGDKLHESLKPDGSHYSWLFWCPACDAPHQCDDRWTFNGDRERPTFGGSVLVHGEPSIGRHRCHSHVNAGSITFCADSTHAMGGKTEELPDWKGFAAERD